MILLNPNEVTFPDPRFIESESGIIAIGGDLSPERLYFAYQVGIFPWFNPGEEILWWCPDPRFVLFPKHLKVSKSMQKIMRQDTFSFSENKCFASVLNACKEIHRKDQDGTWLSDELIDSLMILHQKGIAKSVEVWFEDELVGGLYGIKIGNVFCGESMFAKMTNASKAGFIYFVQKYADSLDVIDCQVYSQHLESLGGQMIPKIDYLKILSKNYNES